MIKDLVGLALAAIISGIFFIFFKKVVDAYIGLFDE
jgi:hypothetical protein